MCVFLPDLVSIALVAGLILISLTVAILYLLHKKRVKKKGDAEQGERLTNEEELVMFNADSDRVPLI